MFGMTIIRTQELPFYREIARLVADKPEYAEGIRQGTVHLKFRPGFGPKKPVKEPITGQTICGSSHTARMAGGESNG